MLDLRTGEHFADQFDPKLQHETRVAMKVGIIEAGEPPPALVPDFGTYDTMTRRLLGEAHFYKTFRALDGSLPRGDECEAYIITGSACSVYDKHAWIEELERLLQSVRHRTKLVGICFDHQIMAQAFGGRVEKSKRGWSMGLHRYNLRQRAEWMDDAEAIWATASHQDQVVAAPADVDVLGAGEVVPYAMLSYRKHPAISVQFHPEFEPAFSRALFEARRAPNLTRNKVLQAVHSLGARNDNARVARWIDNFLAL